MAALPNVATAAPGPIEKDFADTDILVELPEPALTTSELPDSPEQLADTVQNQISRARSTGDPRFLGYADGMLQRWPGEMTDRLLTLRATLDQSLHRFDSARKDLETVIARSISALQKNQALLLLANLETVQGHYEDARKRCSQLQQSYPGLIADSCAAQVDARTGRPAAAYQALQKKSESTSTNTTSQLWAEGTLGDIAAQMGNPAAADHWQTILRISPDDLYTRAQLADWYLSRNQADRTLALTEGYEQVDSLAVLRAIAMARSGHPEAEALAERLRERFAEARWRGNLLHQRDMARFQLDIEGDADTALTFAADNWRSQREPLDTRLLLRAARAAGDEQPAQKVRTWLDKHGQSDARYPEAGS
ncbi:hypothetical protein NLU14_15405 [Marinobacter sp. 71-i]|uniref:Tetratricopeptide repeat protein n=1 Tax=Marinobacter iranensis TaxID=2962607 RepID=A0ABT5YD64_9GAMM|nr:hypothetical protein [Marinobacter iranensis]MDF0751614.1 hypothetical protein [Marinobacter iranensis]